MIIHYPLTAHPTDPPATATRSGRSPVVVVNPGSWKYAAPRMSRLALTGAALLAAGLHAGILFGVRRSAPRPVARPAEEMRIALIPMPEIKELEEPEPVPTDEAAPPIDLGMIVPMQQDLPQLPQPSDFVQQINFASLIEQPDFSQVKVYVIPEHIRTGGNIAEKMGKIFNLEDLDRIPQPVLQPAPAYPASMKREGITATVVVEFIVDAEGRVVHPVIVDTTHSSFDDAAASGVLRWKFRAGVRGGKKVPTRMRVPIVFKTVEPEI